MKKKFLALALVAISALSLVGCKNTGRGTEYTYRTYSTALGANWNPHAWETNAESSMLAYITTPFLDLSIKDSVNQEYQWVYEAATKVEDVTAAHQSDLTKYEVALPEGVEDVAEVTSGYVYEITLREGLKWEDGTPISADDYITSMKLLLKPEMKNYRANLYVSTNSESALAGAYAYYYQGKNYGSAHESYELWSDVVEKDQIFFHWGKDEASKTDFLGWLWGYASYIESGSYGANELEFINNAFSGGPFFADTDALMATLTEMNGKSYAEIEASETYTAALNQLWDFWISEPNVEELDFFAATFMVPEVSFDKVGLYKVSDYVIRYVCLNRIDENYFKTSLTDNWLVNEKLYTKGYDESGELLTTNYCTSARTTMSYGPYKIASLQSGKQLVYVQNDQWYGYTDKDEAGNLVSYTEFKVDGKNVRQYQTTRVVIDVMTDEAAKQAFLKGDLDDWTPAAEELSEYALSSQLYQVDETYTMSFFFNTNVEALQAMDATKGNQNSVVLSNINFRKAFSLAIDRSEWVTATAGYKPAFSLLNRLYYYNVYDDPTSIYRDTDQAKKAIVGLYGVEYGEGKTYATLDDAVNSINGYNLTEAKALMKTACDQLVDAGLYTAGQDIKIKIAYKKGALDSDDNKQVALMQKYLNAAVEGSGFGSVTLEAVGNLEDRYGAVPAGEYAIGYGAWGGAAFYPFRNLQVYMDSAQYDINEGACWDPSVEKFTLTVDGEEYEETYKWWSNSMVGTGLFASADFDTQLDILAALEQDFLSKYYRIPLAGSTACSLLSYKLKYYTEAYNIMYGFGGLRLMTYNYNNSEWAKFVKEHAQKGVLNYS